MTDTESARSSTALRDLDADLDLLGASLDEVCHAGGAGEILGLRRRGDTDAALTRLSLLVINGIASGLRNTG